MANMMQAMGKALLKDKLHLGQFTDWLRVVGGIRGICWVGFSNLIELVYRHAQQGQPAGGDR